MKVGGELRKKMQTHTHTHRATSVCVCVTVRLQWKNRAKRQGPRRTQGAKKGHCSVCVCHRLVYLASFHPDHNCQSSWKVGMKEKSRRRRRRHRQCKQRQCLFVMCASSPVCTSKRAPHSVSFCRLTHLPVHYCLLLYRSYLLLFPLFLLLQMSPCRHCPFWCFLAFSH